MRIVTALLLASLSLKGVAQTSSMGTELWVTYMENLTLMFNGPPSFDLVISSDVSTQGEIQIPATGFAIPFTVSALHDTVVTLPTNIYYPEGDEAIFDFGIRVVADDPVSVYAYHNRVYFSEASMALPIERLGAEHLILAHEDASALSPSEFVVLATQDSTAVEITPSVLTVGFRPPGVPFSVLLDAGQVFQLQASADISGTRVRSLDAAKPVAVFAGARQARVGCGNSADDHLYQQIEPLSGWGTAYRVVPFKLRGGDEVRVLSASDGNTVQLTGQPPFVLDSGQVASLTVAVPLTITATSPIAIGQFNESQDCNPANGDPAYLWLEPSDRWDARAIWSSLDGLGTPSHYLNVVAQGEAGAPVVILDGVNVSAQLAPMAGAPGVYWAQYDVSLGEHVLECPSGCQGSAYGFGDYNSYAFQLGYGGSIIGLSVTEEASVSNNGALILDSDNPLPMGPWRHARVFDLAGRLLRKAQSATPAAIQLPVGHYVVEFTDGEGRSATQRLLVVEH